MRPLSIMLFALLLAISCATLPTNQEATDLRAPASESSTIKYSQISEVEFFRQLEREAARSFDVIRPQLLTPVTFTQWNRMTRVVIENLSKALAFKTLAMNLVHQAGAVVVISEVLTTFVLPPIMIALGQPGLAAFFLTVPFAPIVGGGKVYFSRLLDRYRISHELGISLNVLDKLRTELLGFERKNHVVQLSFENLDLEIPQILEARIVNGIRKGTVGTNEIEISSLVSLVKKSGNEGEFYLSSIAFHRGNSHLYTAELLTFIHSKPELLPELIGLMKSKPTQVAVSENLRRANFRLTEINSEIAQVNQELKTSYKAVKANLISEERSRLNNYLKDLSHVVSDSYKAAQVAEYNLLAVQKNMIDSNSSNQAALEGAEYLLTEIMNNLEDHLKVSRSVDSYLKAEIPYTPNRLQKLFSFEGFLKRPQKLSNCGIWTLGFL